MPPRRAPGALDKTRTFTRTESDRLIAAAASDDEDRKDSTGRQISGRGRDLADLLAFLDATGVRIGEACALRWSDLDLVEGLAAVGGATVVRVRQSDRQGAVVPETDAATALVGEDGTELSSGGLRVVAHGVTKEGARLVALPARIVDRLKARSTARPANRLGLVFPAPVTGELRDPSNTAHHVRDLLNRTTGDDGKPMTWGSAHTFRHSVTERLHLAGVPDQAIATQGGWKSLAVMRSHYLANRATVTTAARDVL